MPYRDVLACRLGAARLRAGIFPPRPVKHSIRYLVDDTGKLTLPDIHKPYLYFLVAGSIAHVLILSLGVADKTGAMKRDLDLLQGRVAVGRTNGAGRVSAATEDKMKQAMDHVRRNFAGDISRQALAGTLDLNSDYLGRAFKIFTGMRAAYFITDVCLDEASERLDGTEDSVIGIAMQAGSDSLRTFNRAFMKRFGMTPTDYRKNNRRAP